MATRRRAPAVQPPRLPAQFVLDASAALARVAADEDLSPVRQRLFDGDIPIAPALWAYETINGLEFMRRRGRLTLDGFEAALQVLDLLPVQLEQPDFARLADRTRELAQRFTLSIYDASYLELAARRRLPLLTIDEALRSAAKKARVRLL